MLIFKASALSFHCWKQAGEQGVVRLCSKTRRKIQTFLNYFVRLPLNRHDSEKNLIHALKKSVS